MSAPELIQIRRFHPRDLDNAARAANSACRQAYAFFGYAHPVATTRQRLLEALEDGQDFWIAEISGAVAGIMTLMPNFIDKLFLAPHHQALGLGSAMISKAKSLYPDYLELHCAQQNHGACRFYEDHAFRPVIYRLDSTIGIPEIVYRWNGV